ncbi:MULTISPECIES: hypothetical protein [Paraburkholderia]|uniref:hypothetical protein n=1 Tax=Paraburkholderia TaxID=1822464 RepID=UPI000B3F73D0|nr:hypothetical protein [Paraburkholderia caledonica]
MKIPELDREFFDGFIDVERGVIAKGRLPFVHSSSIQHLLISSHPFISADLGYGLSDMLGPAYVVTYGSRLTCPSNWMGRLNVVNVCATPEL